MSDFISHLTDGLLSAFAVIWAPACVAVFLFFVVYALWPTNWKKFFPSRPTGADRSPNP